ncbi:MAG TPA: hypothetical protein VNI83_05905 [Vicinamibacterales bacterium]|nr:hypothetical protein [Vicinamibacterales bacterium]
MTRIVPATALAVAFTAVVGAQTPDPQKSKAQPSTAAEKTVTISGCLREGDQPGTFILANADLSALRTEPSTGTPAGTTGSTSATGTVRLIGTGGVNMKEHVGHRVEITGTLAPASERGQARGTTGTPSATETAKEKEKEKEPRVNVRSLKHLSETCS